MTKITNIQLLGEPLPIVGKQYGVGRITGIAGDIPTEFAGMIYSEGKEKVSPINVDNPMQNIAAVYLLVEILPAEDNLANFRIIENYDDFLSPFEFPDKQRGEFEQYFLNKRCDDALVKHFSIQVEDEDAPNGVTTCIAFINIEEIAYIGSEANTLKEFFVPNKLASLQSDTPVRMVFADSLTRAIDVFNQINFYDKAKTIGDIIRNIQAINQDGVKDNLTVAAVDDLFTMVRKEIRIK